MSARWIGGKTSAKAKWATGERWVGDKKPTVPIVVIGHNRVQLTEGDLLNLLAALRSLK